MQEDIFVCLTIEAHGHTSIFDFLSFRSLHFFSGPGGGLPNPYEAAINAVGNIIEDYDSDKVFMDFCVECGEVRR